MRNERTQASNSPDDRELMTRFYGCGEEAFDLLAERWWPRLFGFFRRMGFSSEEGEDLAQETLIRLYQTKERRSFDLSQPLEPFLLTVARNLAVREWRGRRPHRETVPLIEALDWEPDETGLPATMVEDLFLCIWALPEQQRVYVLLSEKCGLGELSHNEIAAILGKWPAQITRISQRAREHLRNCMAGKGYR